MAADYYKQGLAINEEVARAQVARELGLRRASRTGRIGDGDPVRIEIEARDAIPAAEEQCSCGWFIPAGPTRTVLRC